MRETRIARTRIGSARSAYTTLVRARRSLDLTPSGRHVSAMRNQNFAASSARFFPILLVLLFSTLTAGCFALKERIEGTNYAAEGAPFIADDAPIVPSNADLPRQEDLIHRIVLVGDAGVPMDSEPVLASLGRWADVYPDDTTVLFLGDNVYPAGIEEDAVEEGEEILRKQVASTSATRIFIPGNHDWGHLGDDRLLRQQAYLDANGIEFIPRDGCPGPTLRTILPPVPGVTRGISTIVFDIDPWYFAEDGLPKCQDVKTPEALAAEISTLLNENASQWLIVGAHHPLKTGGPHGGFSRGAVADFLTGAVFLIFGTLQDTYEEGYREIFAPIEAALAESPPDFYVAGHDHNLQILEGGAHAGMQIVSGAGATQRVRGGHVTDIEGTLFAHGHPGFVVIDVVRDTSSDGKERAFVHVVLAEQDAPAVSMDGGAP